MPFLNIPVLHCRTTRGKLKHKTAFTTYPVSLLAILASIWRRYCWIDAGTNIVTKTVNVYIMAWHQRSLTVNLIKFSKTANRQENYICPKKTPYSPPPQAWSQKLD